MITLLEHFWIFFIFFAIIVLFRNAKHKLKRNLNESRIKAESAFSKEIYSFFKRSTWLWRVSRKEERRLNRRLKYLGRLRAKAVKRFGCNSRQVELIDRWIAEVQQYIKQFSHISKTAFDLSLWAHVFLNNLNSATL